MSMKFTFPWQSPITGDKSGSPDRGGSWSRKHSDQPQSAPLRSVTMHEDDLDHLGALHHLSEHQPKRKGFGKWF
jgi:hypothetical protein